MQKKRWIIWREDWFKMVDSKFSCFYIGSSMIKYETTGRPSHERSLAKPRVRLKADDTSLKISVINPRELKKKKKTLSFWGS